MWPSESSLFQQFEQEGEAMVRRRLDYDPPTAHAAGEQQAAARWLEMKARERERANRAIGERQVRMTEEVVQLNAEHVRLANKAVQLAEKADADAARSYRISIWALCVGLAGVIVAIISLVLR